MTADIAPRAKSNQPSLKDLASELFSSLSRTTGDGVGITRQCYSETETRALKLFEETAVSHGLRASYDAVQNLVVHAPWDDGRVPAIYVGSHADSVPQGGNFDGAAGIVAGLLTLISLQKLGDSIERPVRLIALRGEESAFYGRANLGARALFGLLDEKDLTSKCRGNGSTLLEAMELTGVSVDQAQSRQALLDSSQISGYLELHIEQGPVMIARDLPIAIVTGIRGNLRHQKIVCRGEPGHSGAVPRWLRKDAVFAFSDLVMRLDEHWQRLLERGLDIVVTTGIVGTDPSRHAMSRVPGEIEFSFEVRSQSHDTLEAFYELFRTECKAISVQRGVRFEFDDRIYTEPGRMSEKMIDWLSKTADRLGLPRELMPSGAGHDAVIFANAGVPSAMIFIRNSNGSHNPQEAMSIDDFMKGVDLLVAALSQ